ncbi:GNAT family N-acetyltransferase [Conexibacter arvalis]|uniref:Ribosomal-protein-alanine N-acetyltransferase n=1 Tax=Conexibacter arvalis TaxID=912552 RepID=A0A840I8U1_9ACTN|nr:GNAT family N-acetyltransferase [Conexibacter arvalis]MBB4661329.1 ribosomal-protein-alanine N-acetyltransferase [Conexibacter arvalis]
MTAFPERIETERLVATRCDAEGELDAFAPLFADEAIARTMWPAHLGGPRTREQTYAWLARYDAHWEAHGFGPWTVRERDGEQIVGHVGLSYTVVAGRAEVEAGFILAPDRWGRGYAAEVTTSALAHAHAIRGLESVVAFAMPDLNPRAVATIERCGFAYEGETTVVELPHRLYRIAVS